MSDDLRPPALAPHHGPCAAQLSDTMPEARRLRKRLDTWSGLGNLIDGMSAHDCDARLYQSVFRRRAEFDRTQVNPLPGWIGMASNTTPWQVIQARGHGESPA